MINKQHPAFDDLQKSFELYANRTALFDKDGTAYTYAEFQQFISGAYYQLQQLNVKKGDKILVAVPMSLQLYAILEAIFALGATAVFLDPWMKGKKMDSVIQQVKPDLFIVTKKLSRITWLLPATWKLKKWKVSSIEKRTAAYEIVEVSDEDNALITFTSGTSGQPKGANRTFAFIHAQAETLKAHLGDKVEHSIDYTNFPIVGLANFALGNTVAIPQLNLMKIHKADPKEIVTQIEKQGVNRLVVSPSLLKKVLEEIPENNSLKTVMTGGAPVSISLVKTALKKCPKVDFQAIYGSTEAEPICMTTFSEINEQLKEPLKGVYVGQPVDEIKLKIIKTGQHKISTEMFDSLVVNGNRIGEVVVTGDHVNKSYYKNKEAFLKNKIVDSDGEIWHRTGDIGYLENKVLFLVGRDHRLMSHNHHDKPLFPYPIEQFIEIEFGLDDIGYIQLINREFVLYYYSKKQIDETKLRKAMLDFGYPVDRFIRKDKPLPRDARHKSKLQIEQLT